MKFVLLWRTNTKWQKSNEIYIQRANQKYEKNSQVFQDLFQEFMSTEVVSDMSNCFHTVTEVSKQSKFMHFVSGPTWSYMFVRIVMQ